MPNASKEELLKSISSNMKLSKAFFLRIYGHAINSHEFSEVALSRLESVGCSQARTYYNDIVKKYEKEQKTVLKKVAEWYAGVLKNKWQQEQVKQDIADERRSKCQFNGLPQDW